MSDNQISKEECVIERTFDASAAVVWQMWTQPEHFKSWYGPNGFTIPVAEMDVRVGGKRLVCMEMQRPDGVMKMWTTGEFTEVSPHTRLVYTDSPADENGNVVSPASIGMPAGYPAVTEVIVVLREENGRVKMTMTHTGVPASATGGWNQAFAKMEAHMATVAK